MVSKLPIVHKRVEEPRVGSYGPFKRKAGTSVFGHGQTNLNPTFRFQRQQRARGLLCRKIVSSFVLLRIFISFLCCLAEKGQGEASKRLKIAEKLQSVYLKIDKKTLFFVIYPKIVNRKEFMVTYPPSKRIFSSKVLFANVCIISFFQQPPSIVSFSKGN